MGQVKDLILVEPVLSTIAHGYQNSELISKQLFPVVSLKKPIGKIPLFTKEDFRIRDTARALRSVANRIQTDDISTTEFSMTEHALETSTDYMEFELTSDYYDLMQRKTNTVVYGIKLVQEKYAADLVQDRANYADTNKTTITTDKFSNPSTDPIAIIQDCCSDLRSIIGKTPNTMTMGRCVYNALKSHPKIIERIKYSQVGIVTMDLMKALFDIPNILVGDSVFVKDDNTFEDIWKDNVILSYATSPTGMSKTPYEPSYGYTLQLDGFPQIDVRDDLGTTSKIVRCRDYWAIKIVGSDSAYLLYDVL